jgi:hypothetical protein
MEAGGQYLGLRPVERRAAAQTLDQDQAQGVHVGFRADLVAQ